MSEGSSFSEEKSCGAWYFLLVLPITLKFALTVGNGSFMSLSIKVVSYGLLMLKSCLKLELFNLLFDLYLIFGFRFDWLYFTNLDVTINESKKPVAVEIER